MRLNARRLLIFVAQFAAFFIMFLFIYPLLLPIYNSAVVLWSLLTWRYWLPKAIAPAAVPTPHPRKQHHSKETRP